MFDKLLSYHLLLCLSALPLVAQEVVIELQNPVATQKSVQTKDGGILETDELRIQAKNIEYYSNNENEKIVEASGDLLIVYRKKFFIGDSIVFNLNKQEGVLKNANGFAGGLFFGGKEILLHKDGSLDAESAFVTTSDNDEPEWSVKSEKIHMNEKYKVRADNITMNVDKYPVLWLPSYSIGVNSRFKSDSKLKYRILWERGQGPLLLSRFRIWDSDTLKVFVRGEYRVKRGGGGAIELNYLSPDQKHSFETRNFYAYDTVYNDAKPNQLKSRYRLQGIYSSQLDDNKIELFARWDALSDKNMRSDFPTQLFELSTLERTEGFIKAHYDIAFGSLYARPRLNSFRGFKQELPTLTVSMKPLSIGNTGFVFDNFFRFAYLDYVYADNLRHQVPDFHSGRLETKQDLYRSFQLGALTLLPKVGFKGILYTNNPKNQTVAQAVVDYNVDLTTTLKKSYGSYEHSLEPYAKFNGLTAPTAKMDDVYIFSSQDGFNSLNQLKIGLRNDLYCFQEFSPKPLITSDLYAYHFINATTFKQPFPKLGWRSSLNLSRVSLDTHLGWNFERQMTDYINLKLGYTFSDYLAFTAEVRHRGPYDWKKSDASNYLLDISHSIDSLEDSPLSDLRTTFRCKWQLQVAPLWTVRVINHIGWRPDKPFYHATKVELQTYISNAFKLKLTYSRTAGNNEFTFGFNLI